MDGSKRGPKKEFFVYKKPTIAAKEYSRLIDGAECFS